MKRIICICVILLLLQSTSALAMNTSFSDLGTTYIAWAQRFEKDYESHKFDEQSYLVVDVFYLNELTIICNKINKKVDYVLFSYNDKEVDIRKVILRMHALIAALEIGFSGDLSEEATISAYNAADEIVTKFDDALTQNVLSIAQGEIVQFEETRNFTYYVMYSEGGVYLVVK